MITNSTLYKKDKNGNTRVWWVEYNDEGYLTKSGVLGGSIVESGLTRPTAKNVGKVNATSVATQVVAEVEALYKYQLYQGKYHETIDTIDDGASFVECQLADKFNAKKHNQFPYIGQPKFDGARALGVDFVTLQTRNGKRHVSCPHILEEVAQFQDEFPEHILDGELYNHDLKNDFEKLMSMVRKSKNITSDDLAETKEKVFFYVYDIIMPNPIRFEERLQFLENQVYGNYPSLRAVEWSWVYDEDGAAELLAKHLEMEYEGTMLRNPDSFYQNGRTKDLIKYKVFEDIECEVVDIIEGIGTWSGRAKSVTIKLPNGIIQESGVKGNFAFTEQLLRDREQLIGTDVTVQFQRKTSDGKLKFPVVAYWWKGKRDV